MTPNVLPLSTSEEERLAREQFALLGSNMRNGVLAEML